MIVAMAGLAAVLHTSAVLFQAIKFVGVAYLLWMGWAVLKGGAGWMWRRRPRSRPCAWCGAAFS